MTSPLAAPSDQLPSVAQLRRAAIIASIVGVVLGVTVVLPAERGIDPTGVGQLLGLKEMGEFKVEAAKEYNATQEYKAAQDAAR